MMTIPIRAFSRRREGSTYTLTAEAGDLGIAPGAWPQTIAVQGDRELVEFHRQAAEMTGPAHERELAGWWYAPTTSKRAVLILVIND